MSKLELRGALDLLIEMCENDKFDYQLPNGDWIYVVRADVISEAIKQIREEAGLDAKR